MKLRPAVPADGEAVMRLAERAYSPRPVWSGADGWRRFYFGYPIEGVLVMLAVDDQDCPVGHCGFLPTTVSGHRAFFQTNAFIAPENRDGDLFRQIVAVGEAHARACGAEFLVTFTSGRTAEMFRRLFGWTVVGAIDFTRRDKVDPSGFADRLRFEPSPDWYLWRFNRQAESYVLPYSKDGKTTLQLWKTQDDAPVNAEDHRVDALDCWHPDSYRTEISPEATSCLLVKPISGPLPPRITDIRNWYIEIGDSDLAYRPTDDTPYPF